MSLFKKLRGTQSWVLDEHIPRQLQTCKKVGWLGLGLRSSRWVGWQSPSGPLYPRFIINHFCRAPQTIPLLLPSLPSTFQTRSPRWWHPTPLPHPLPHSTSPITLAPPQNNNFRKVFVSTFPFLRLNCPPHPSPVLHTHSLTLCSPFSSLHFVSFFVTNGF